MQENDNTFDFFEKHKSSIHRRSKHPIAWYGEQYNVYLLFPQKWAKETQTISCIDKFIILTYSDTKMFRN
jgi:hypothetical protein